MKQVSFSSNARGRLLERVHGERTKADADHKHSQFLLKAVAGKPARMGLRSAAGELLITSLYLYVRGHGVFNAKSLPAD